MSAQHPVLVSAVVTAGRTGLDRMRIWGENENPNEGESVDRLLDPILPLCQCQRKKISPQKSEQRTFKVPAVILPWKVTARS